MELLGRAHRPAAGDDDLGGGQFRPVGLHDFIGDEAGCVGRPAAVDRLDRRRAALAGRLERVVRTVITFLASLDCTVSSALPA